jgi:hypothetical protein
MPLHFLFFYFEIYGPGGRQPVFPGRAPLGRPRGLQEASPVQIHPSVRSMIMANWCLVVPTGGQGCAGLVPPGPFNFFIYIFHWLTRAVGIGKTK